MTHEDILNCNEFQIDFVGWTFFGNSAYPDFIDVIDRYSIYEVDDEASYMRKRVDKKGCEKIVKRLQVCQDAAFEILRKRLKSTGIRFSGERHQTYEYGCPVIKISRCNDAKELEGLEIKLTCSFRSWGGYIAEACGTGTYLDWAWYDSEDPVFPDSEMQDENCIDSENQVFPVQHDFDLYDIKNYQLS